MASLLLEPPTNSSPQTAVNLAQRASSFVTSQSSWLSSLRYPLNLFINTESQEKWQAYENLLLACLRTGDDTTAYTCLEALTDRFGRSNDRILSLQGLYKEATAKNDAELAAVLAEYEDILRSDSTIFSIRKRRAALLRSMGKTTDAIAALTNILDQSPTDVETWSELGDMYLVQGSYEQAVFCFEEVLLVTPNSWNMQARLGEVLYLVSDRTEGAEQLKVLSESMRRFCRSIELCDNYLRGYYGLKLTTNRLLEVLQNNKKSQQASTDPVKGDLAPPTIASIQKLNEISTSKLAEIVRKSASGDKNWDGYSAAEIIVARELLDRDTQKIAR